MAIAWAAFVLIVTLVHVVSAIRLDPVVEARLADGCFEWCGLDRAVHQFSAGVGLLVLVAWTPILWTASRTAARTRVAGHIQWMMTAAVLLLIMFLSTFVQPGHGAWFLNVGACVVVIVLGGINVWQARGMASMTL